MIAKIKKIFAALMEGLAEAKRYKASRIGHW